MHILPLVAKASDKNAWWPGTRNGRTLSPLRSVFFKKVGCGATSVVVFGLVVIPVSWVMFTCVETHQMESRRLKSWKHPGLESVRTTNQSGNCRCCLELGFCSLCECSQQIDSKSHNQMTSPRFVGSFEGSFGTTQEEKGGFEGRCCHTTLSASHCSDTLCRKPLRARVLSMSRTAVQSEKG